MADNDFERLCAAFWHSSDSPRTWEWMSKHMPTSYKVDQTRRGVTAVLRDLRGRTMPNGEVHAIIDELLRQAGESGEG